MLTGLESMCEIQWAGAKRGSICCDARITFSFTLTGCLYPSMLHHAAHLLFFYLTGHCWLEILYVYVCVYTYEWLLMHHLLAIYPPSQAFGASFFFLVPHPNPIFEADFTFPRLTGRWRTVWPATGAGVMLDLSPWPPRLVNAVTPARDHRVT